MKIIILYISCKKTTERFLNLECIRKYEKVREKYSDIHIYRILGKNNECDFPTFYVDCEDYYENLPAKVALGIKKAYEKFPDLDYIVKVDDDTEINLDTLIEFIEKNKELDYSGYVISAPYGRIETHHIGKCNKEEYNKLAVSLPPFIICIGVLYILSKKSVKVVIENDIPYNQIYEDVHMGVLLENNNIKTTHIHATSESKHDYLTKKCIGWHNKYHTEYEPFEIL